MPSPTQGLCTAALPGAVFQEIYVCRRCCGGPEDDNNDANNDAAIQQQQRHPACLCHACAQACHGDCTLANGDSSAVEYVGVGPASCDCHALSSSTNDSGSPTTTAAASSCCGCRLHDASTAWAAECEQATQLVSSWDAVQCTWPRTTTDAPPVQVHRLLGLNARALVSQAQVLVQHSKETFWMDAAADEATTSSLSRLEDLAWQLLQQHNITHGVTFRGAEWWVQVKQAATNSTVATTTTTSIDLHYDKDEFLAAACGIGVFPTLSTVTYLTGAPTTTTSTTADVVKPTISATPTLIFPRTYHDPADELLPHVWQSRPVVGKHLVFDGALLHGAVPLEQAQEDALSPSSALVDHADDHDNGLRVTFLVNLWESHRPLGIEPLPARIRRVLQEAMLLLEPTSSSSSSQGGGGGGGVGQTVAFASSPVTQFPSLSAASTEWTSLPFVEDGMVVQTVRFPTEGVEDTVLIQYHVDQQAYLDYPDNDDDEADDQAEREQVE